MGRIRAKLYELSAVDGEAFNDEGQCELSISITQVEFCRLMSAESIKPEHLEWRGPVPTLVESLDAHSNQTQKCTFALGCNPRATSTLGEGDVLYRRARRALLTNSASRLSHGINMERKCTGRPSLLVDKRSRSRRRHRKDARMVEFVIRVDGGW